ncbi:MAG: ribosomal RNA small subunit methyltransferase A [Candidatus Harrisonbacteria bacterium CG10_big_fil_rev_8_21_14_0_10_42_17]|uniref:Ribosomal RNA small subunit methyltransferase A n=1 Tax=Candidatus Harrisonbacteria bacterium CG10_big_fil_rev_8_21_14_0_10_42_17 TaxID=1974584 RepID=A0A2M6WIW2_9BACT|nr:MAG: ribosomal RNA small subunit methyltransferase A [Candidatus Harrisonbacteria bacterium CG10_big_fil_rev_8_21_14_0_10_42_17]
MPRRLGQHFLKNTASLATILTKLDPQPQETIIEIGPGTGILTHALHERCLLQHCQIVGVEKDSRLFNSLSRTFPNQSLIRFVYGDILTLLPQLTAELRPHSYSVVGNIPYYISGKLLRILGELFPRPRAIILMLQKEVALRVSAQPPSMNLLAASVQVWAKSTILASLSPHDFSPPPKVNSSILLLRPHANNPVPQHYYDFIRILFKQPRKTILNNLAAGYPLSKEAIVTLLASEHLSGRERPQHISLEILIKLGKLYGLFH